MSEPYETDNLNSHSRAAPGRICRLKLPFKGYTPAVGNNLRTNSSPLDCLQQDCILQDFLKQKNACNPTADGSI
ncbi:hypothetical protein EVA_08925 [gut metagenome]|uniref:Uncharacterized protein n=1 Tax=gut metagenome TaxID=749906 RepID=J9G7X0_9ZZZZ